MPTAILHLAGRDVPIHRTGKVLFPDSGFTKLDLAEYYAAVAPRMLPHLVDRPLTLERFPDGIAGEGFYQKEASKYFPPWIPRVEMRKEGGVVHHVVCKDDASLVYLADQACVTFHAALGRADLPRKPDRLIFDLDPPGDRGEPPANGSLEGVLRSLAQDLHALLDGELGLPCFLMATGSRGFHVTVPIARRHDFATTRAFARSVAELVAAREPAERTVEPRKKDRGDRIYVDVLRNGYAQTAVAPYSVRARRGAPVATPLTWGELDEATPGGYDVETVRDRLQRHGDPWTSFPGSPPSLGDARKALAKLHRTASP